MYALTYGLFWRFHHHALTARRRDRTWRYLLWSAVAGLIAGGMIAVGTFFSLVLWRAGIAWFVPPMIVIMILPVIADTVARHVFVPLGLVRAAYYSGLYRRGLHDAPAHAMTLAAWACACRPSPAGEAWLLAKRDARIPLGDAEVVVTALLAAGRGDPDTARALLRSTVMMVETHPTVRELAGEWLACDAAERGAWATLADDAAAARWPATPLTYVLEGIAARRIAAPGAPGDVELWARWLLAPHRHVTYPLVDDLVRGKHLAAAPAPAPAPDAARDASETAPATAALPHAVAAHLAIGRATADALAAAVRAWDAALGAASTHAWLAMRARELDAPLGAVDRALRDVTTAVTDDLAHAAEAAGLGTPASRGAVGDALAHRLRHGRLDALDAGFARWADRRADGAARAGIDEWRELVALHDAYAAAVSAGGIELRRLAFPHAYRAGNTMATWLWNARKEYVISHAISHWLLVEALAVGDAQAIELGHRNCSLDIPTRLGSIKPT